MTAGIENHRIGSGLSAGIGIGLLILTLFFHVSCVDQKMTVKEAKQVTDSMGGKSFEPPPRHVDDILAVLDEADPVDHAMVYRLQETAASPAPSTADQKTRMMFYFNRGKAAYSLGRVLLKRGRVEDARNIFSKALQIVKTMGTQEDSFALGSMRVALGIAMAGEEDFEGAMEQFDRARVGLETNRFMYKR